MSRSVHASIVAAYVLTLCIAAGCGSTESDAHRGEVPAPDAPHVVKPVGQTAAVPHDPDDPAIWIHPADSSRSLILGTDKIEAAGGLYVFDLDGNVRQSIAPLDRPNNVDVEYGFALGGRRVDIAVVTERKRHRLRVFAIAPEDGTLTDLVPEGLPVLEGALGEEAEPMGIALYKRPRDGALFAIVSPKTGPATDYLWQYRLDGHAADRVTATFVRRFGAFSRVGETPGEIGEIEAIVVDDELGYVYYADERYAVRKYHADPDHPSAASELAAIGTSGYVADREGLAIFQTGERTGYLVSSDQVEGGTRVRLYKREGEAANPHDHAWVDTVLTVSDETDGLEVTSRALPRFPRGLLVMMSAGTRNFLLYDWRGFVPVEQAGRSRSARQDGCRRPQRRGGAAGVDVDLLLRASALLGALSPDAPDATCVDAPTARRMLERP